MGQWMDRLAAHVALGEPTILEPQGFLGRSFIKNDPSADAVVSMKGSHTLYGVGKKSHLSTMLTSCVNSNPALKEVSYFEGFFKDHKGALYL